jgi:hypothetical protein
MDDIGRDGGAQSQPLRKPSPSPATDAAAAPAAPARPERRVASLADAMRRARVDNANRSEALADLRTAEIARLEMLREALEPVLAQLPKNCDLFDVAVSPGERPRLFVDQIGYVEMSHDRHTYRFLQDTRHGRIEVCESDDPDVLVEGITAYIAHRLIEREKALAADYASSPGGAAQAARAAVRAQAGQPAPQPRMGRRALQIYLFFMEYLGAVLTFGLLYLLGRWLWQRFGAGG